MAHTLATVITDGVNPFELSVACEVFGQRRPRLGAEVSWYDFRLCAPTPTVRLRGGYDLTVPHGLDALTDADTIVVPNAPVEPGVLPDKVLDALAGAHTRGARLVSYCSGAFALGEAGVLDGHRATTHWMYVEQFRTRFPRVTLEPNVLFVDEGAVLTSAGTAAGIDLSLHLVRRDHGAEIARQVARYMVVPPHRDGGQAQFIDPPHQPREPTDDLARLLDWATQHLDRNLTVETLAQRMSMSPRTFLRRFKEATGTTPARWLATQRLQLAQRLLETTDLDIDRIAAESGLGTAANLRQRFRAELDTTPSAYRRTFQLGS